MAKVIAQADADHYLAQKTAEANKVDDSAFVCISVHAQYILVVRDLNLHLLAINTFPHQQQHCPALTAVTYAHM